MSDPYQDVGWIQEIGVFNVVLLKIGRHTFWVTIEDRFPVGHNQYSFELVENLRAGLVDGSYDAETSVCFLSEKFN